jgi:hypothetical protein
VNIFFIGVSSLQDELFTDRILIGVPAGTNMPPAVRYFDGTYHALEKGLPYQQAP